MQQNYADPLQPFIVSGQSTPQKQTIWDKFMATWPARLAQTAWQAVKLPGDVYSGKIIPNSNEEINRAADLASVLTLGAGAIPAETDALRMGIKAYHGSPYNFEKFDTAKIGTGEGAQVYGHGLYFAENPKVAQSYKFVNSSPGLGVYPATLAKSAADKAAAIGLKGDAAKQFALNDLSERSKTVPLSGRQALYDAMNNYDQLNGGLNSVGKMYEVNINAEPHQFLDWDKPLSQQPPAFAPFAKEAAYQTGRSNIDFLPMEDAIPVLGNRRSTQFGSASRSMGAAKLSDELSQVGLPGIKYLDQGSRFHVGGEHILTEPRGNGWQATIRINTEPSRFTKSKIYSTKEQADTWAKNILQDQGTRNYVIFDPSIVDIVRKYALPGAVSGPSMYGVINQQDNAR